MKKLGFVIPWHGENIQGGAEAALRDITDHLFTAGFKVEILTTCVRDFKSNWNKNFYKPGSYVVRGIPVLRFKVRERNEKLFDIINSKLLTNEKITSLEEKTFCEEMINSPDLYMFLENNQKEYSFFIFIPYMFGTTYYGCQICPKKSILIPCFHEESYINIELFKK